MAQRDYYEVLGIEKSATEADIKKAYRRLAMKYHPDRNSGEADAENKFKEASEAFEILSDQKKRAAYDQFGHAGVDASAGQGGFGGGDFGDIFGDVFGDIFGGNGRRGGGARVQRGADLQYNLEIDLEEAVRGTETKIEIPTRKHCKTCDGSGAKPGTSAKTCGTCQGHGQVRMQQGFFSVQQTCPTCRGNGKVIEEACAICSGRGWEKTQKTLSVKIPAGVDNGDRVRLSNEGEPGENGGPSGDLYVMIHVSEHEIFTRDDENLLCEVPIDMIAASLGGELEVPTLDGRVKLKIPAGTQTGKQFRLRGKGVKSVRGGAVGDLLCRVRLETPVNLSAAQKELLTQLGETLGVKHSPQKHSWLDGVKRFFDDVKSNTKEK